MSPTPDRISRMRDVTAMAAMDTMPFIAERIRNLVSHGRRISYTRRYTYTQEPPDLTVGQTLREGDRGISEWAKDDQAGIDVRLDPGLLAGFGIGVTSWEAPTEADAWKRYHAEKDQPRHPRRLTMVDITGGMPGDGPARDDRLVIRYWNDDGVCTETVVAFDAGEER